jgi:HK97 family phage major capsid protein/HK97 family phage prohead protease
MEDFQAWLREFPERYKPFNPYCARDLSKEPAKLFRYMELDGTRAQETERTVEATLSTETPVFRGHYHEILRHDENSVDLSRAKEGLPLLWSHNPEQQIGVVENIRVYDKKLRGRLRFSESAQGQEKFRDVQQGILKGISIGYLINNTETVQADDYRDSVVATRWLPFEVSAVSVPADNAAGIGRALAFGQLRESPVDLTQLDKQYGIFNHYNTFIKPIETLPEIQPALAELHRLIPLIKTQGDYDAAHELLLATFAHARDCPDVEHNGPLLSYRKQEEKHMEKFQPFFNTRTTRGDNPDNFSLCRALAMTFDPGAVRRGGPEYEIMQDAARARGKSLGDRYTLPEAALFRSVTKGGSGGSLIGDDHLAEQFVPALRSRLITGRMGATILAGLQADVTIPRCTADSSAGWIAGDGSDQVESSDPTYDQISMIPKSVGCYSTLSRKMLLQGDPGSDQLVRESLAYAVALALDTAAINGSGSSNQPLGILNQDNVATDTYTTAPNFGELVDMEGALMVDDADLGNMGYLTTGAMAATMKKTPIVTAMDTMIWTSAGDGQGRVNGYRAMTSNLIPTGYVLFGNWSDLLIGLWSGLDFVIDPYTRSRYGDVIITIFQDADVAVRHGESFAEIHAAG